MQIISPFELVLKQLDKIIVELARSLDRALRQVELNVGPGPLAR